MRKLGLVLAALLLLPQIARGGTIMNPQILNNVMKADQFAGADMCAKISAAFLALPSTGGVVDARGFTGSQNCATNPFSGGTAKRVTLLLGRTDILTTAQWAVWNHAQIIGSGQDQSRLEAVSGFPSATALIRLGAVADAATVTGVRVSDMWIDCNGLTTCTGIQSTVAGDGCGGSRLTIEKYKARGISMEGISDKYLFDDIIMGVATSQTTTRSLYVDPAAGTNGVFRRISIKSLNATQQTVPAVDIGSGAHLYDLQINDTADGVLFNTNASGSAEYVTIGTNVTNAVRIVGTGTVHLESVVKGAATVTIKNDNTTTTTAQAIVSSYDTNAQSEGTTFTEGTNDGFKIVGSATAPGSLLFQRVVAGAVTATPMSIDSNGSLSVTKLQLATGQDGTRYMSLAGNTLDMSQATPPVIVSGGVILYYGLGAAGVQQPMFQNATDRALQLINSKTWTVATLPAASTTVPAPNGNVGWMLAVNDSTVSGKCTTGGGAKLSLCRSDGTNWVGVGDGNPADELSNAETGLVFWGTLNASYDSGDEVCVAHQKVCVTTANVIGTPIACNLAHVAFAQWLAFCK